MNPQKMKRDIGALTISMLDQLGLLHNGEISEGVELYSTPDTYLTANNDLMMAAGVNNKKAKFVLVSNGLILSKENAEKQGKEVEVSQLYIDKAKASLLRAAINFAFPELNESNVSSNIFDALPDICQTLDINFKNLKSVDETIGYLKNKMHELEDLKSKGFDKVIVTDTKSVSFSKEKLECLTRSEEKQDELINFHLKNKEYAGQFDDEVSDVIVHNEKNKTFYISLSKKSKLLKLVEANVIEQANQNLNLLPINKSTKTMLIDRNLAKKLLTVLKDWDKNEVCTS